MAKTDEKPHFWQGEKYMCEIHGLLDGDECQGEKQNEGIAGGVGQGLCPPKGPCDR